MRRMRPIKRKTRCKAKMKQKRKFPRLRFKIRRSKISQEYNK